MRNLIGFFIFSSFFVTTTTSAQVPSPANPYRAGPHLLSGNSCILPEGTCTDHAISMDKGPSPHGAPLAVFMLYCDLQKGRFKSQLCERKKFACGYVTKLKSADGFDADVLSLKWSEHFLDVDQGCKPTKPI